MGRDEFLRALDDLLELDKGTLQGSEKLTELEGWDSLSIVSFMGLAQTHFKTTPAAKRIASCESINDLYSLVNEAKA